MLSVHVQASLLEVQEQLNKSLGNINKIYLKQVYPGGYCSCRLRQQFEFYTSGEQPVDDSTTKLPLFIGNYDKSCCEVGYTGKQACCSYFLRLNRNGEQDDKQEDPFSVDVIKLKNCCCSLMPRFQIKSGNELIGEIQGDINGFGLPTLHLICDGNEQCYIKAKSTCQFGICCQTPCGCNPIAVFCIYDMARNEVAQIVRTTRDQCKSGEAANDYNITLPPNVSPSCKLLIMVSTIVIDRTVFYARLCK